MKLTDVTYLIFEINAAIDSGNYQNITLAEVREEALKGNLFPFLKSRLGDDLDLSLYDLRRLQELSDALKGIAEVLEGRERRKTGVERSGLCVLIAYMTELIQRKEHEGWGAKE